MILRRRATAWIALCFAVVACACVFPGFAFAQGRALVCTQLDGDRGVTPFMLTEDPDGLLWEGLAVVPEAGPMKTNVGSDVAKLASARSYTQSKGAEISLVTSDSLTSDQLVTLLEKRPDVLFAEVDRAYTAEELWGGEGDFPAVASDAAVTLRSGAANTAFDTNADIIDPLSPYYSFQWFLANGGTWTSGVRGVDINLPSGASDGSGAVVAVLDTGVDSTHPNLQGNMINLDAYPDFQAETGCGRVGYNASTGINEDRTDSEDYYLHGTHVAGIVAASGLIGSTPAGAQGVASGSTIVAVRTRGDDSFIWTSAIVRGFAWLVKANEAGVGISAVNVSLGSTGESKIESLMYQALEDAGIVLVSSSGNSDENLDVAQSNFSVGTAASTLLVNALQADGKKAPYSCYGQRTTDLFAPGSSVLSSVPSIAACFNAFTAAQNARTSQAGSTQAFVYEGFETDSSSSVDGDVGGGLSFNSVILDDAGEPAQTFDQGMSLPTTTDQWFLGAASLAVTQPVGASKTALLSQEIDLTKSGANTPSQLYAGTSAYASTGNNFVYFQYRLTDGTYSPRTTTRLAKADFNQWRTSDTAATQALPENVDLEHFQILVTVDFDAALTDTTVYLDCIGIGCGIEKYAVYGGTSMAAPVVTGAVGVLAATYPDESAQQRSARIKGGTTYSESLDGLCESSGYLNMEKALYNPNPVPESVSANGTTATLSGWFFTQGDAVFVNGTEVSPTEWNTDSMGRTVVVFALPDTAQDGKNEFSITSAEGTGRTLLDIGALNRTSGYTDLALPEGDIHLFPVLAATNEGIYLCSNISNDEEVTTLQRYDSETNTWTNTGDIPYSQDVLDTIAAEGGNYEIDGIVGVGSFLYLPIYVYQDADGATLATPHSWLMTYDCIAGTWTTSSDWGDALVGSRLVNWKERLCLAGGLRTAELTPIDTVAALDPVTGTQSVLGHLPLAVGWPIIVASGDELIFSGGLMQNDEINQDMYVTDLTTENSYPFLGDYDPSLSRAGVMAPVQEGIVLVGLNKQEGTTQSDTVVLDKKTGIWTWTEKLCSSLPMYDTSIIQKDGKVYVWGYSDSSQDFYLFRSTEVNDPNPTPVPTPDPDPTPEPEPTTPTGSNTPAAKRLVSTGDSLLALPAFSLMALLSLGVLGLTRRQMRR